MSSNPSSSSLQTPPLRLWRKGKIITLGNVAPSRTLLDLLRDDLRACDTKEGCASGDCGACTVVVASARDDQQLEFHAINSCIRPAHAVDGMAVWTAADISKNDGTLHPVQQAMVSHHGSQCGFCTPGFVMSMFSLYQRTCTQGKIPDAHDIQEALSGNLCRCTGYRPIVDAAHAMAQAPVVHEPQERIAQSLQEISPRDNTQANYALPTTLEELLRLRAKYPQAQLIGGATDVGVLITQGLREMPHFLDLTRVQELKQIERYPHHIAIGAAVTLQDAFDGLAQERPTVAPFAARFAGWPIRQSGTLGGNVANGSPIGDSMPLLIALDASVVLMAWRGGRVVHRELPLHAIYTGYRQNVIQADEVLAWIKVPHPQPNEWLGLYKISKRMEDDISAVCLAIRIEMKKQQLDIVRIGAGGVAAMPVRAVQTEKILQGQADAEEVWLNAGQVIAKEFNPLSDLRASDRYRRTLLTNLMERAWLERLGQHNVRLENLS